MAQPPLNDDENGAPGTHRFVPDSAATEEVDDHVIDDEPHVPTVPQRPPLKPGTRASIGIAGIAVTSCVAGSLAGNGLIYLLALVAGATALILFLRARRGTVQEAEESAKDHVRYYRHYNDPSKRTARVLNEVEEFYIETQEHSITMLPWALLALVATLAAGWIGHTAGDFRGVAIIWIAAMCYVAYKVWVWQRESFIVTDQYIRMTSGILEDHAPRMNIAAVTDAKKHVPWHSKLLFKSGCIKHLYGTFTLETAGQDQPINKAKWLPFIDELDVLISALSRGKEPYPNEGPETSFPYR
jgi:hypothetical protein